MEQNLRPRTSNQSTLLRKLELRINIPHKRGGGGQRGVSSRNHEDHFSRVTKNKISFSRFLETQKRNKV